MATMTSTTIPALSRESLRNQMKTTMMGRRAGMDNNDYEVGEQDTRLPIEVITTTAASSLSPNGFTNLASTVASSAVYTLLAPVSGIYKTITQVCSGTTLGFAVQFGTNAQIITTAGSSFNQIVFGGIGHSICMVCVSTSTSVGV